MQIPSNSHRQSISYVTLSKVLECGAAKLYNLLHPKFPISFRLNQCQLERMFEIENTDVNDDRISPPPKFSPIRFDVTR